ncbi:hypothetical protein LJB71_01970 [Thermomonas sp. S9]|uniref:hypothetical protein n=1 Tax=Thermomonas sp. S9 TaxID=2885203 RepID=UPI00216B3BE5|nr:hypothetical protein [Thermomonas sp. S9]MCR6495133.1 hypothetical protein [Thermomonas sp. S9]
MNPVLAQQVEAADEGHHQQRDPDTPAQAGRATRVGVVIMMRRAHRRVRGFFMDEN